MAVPVVIVLAVASCSSSKGSADRSKSTTSTSVVAVPAGSNVQPSAKEALQKLLAAEKVLDHAASFQYVLHGADQPYKTVGAWTKRRNELPAVAGFSVEANGDAAATATVEHRPGLDSFIGLSPARDRETWKAVRAGSGWLLVGDPEVVPELPPDSGAADGARKWIAAVQACDQRTADASQAVEVLFDSTTQTPQLCRAAGDVRTGAVGSLAPGPASGDIVSQYTSDALTWARVVQVESPARFAVVLAPIGPDWKVLGLTDHS